MAPMIRNELQALWRRKELERGHIITVQSVAQATGLNWETVDKLKRGETTRFDAKVMAQVCKFFDVEDGQPVPFLVYAEV